MKVLSLQQYSSNSVLGRPLMPAGVPKDWLCQRTVDVLVFLSLELILVFSF